MLVDENAKNWAKVTSTERSLEMAPMSESTRNGSLLPYKYANGRFYEKDLLGKLIIGFSFKAG